MSKHRVPGYVEKMRAQAEAAGYPPGVYDVEIRHDDWCAIFKGGQCNCEPDVMPMRKISE